MDNLIDQSYSGNFSKLRIHIHSINGNIISVIHHHNLTVEREREKSIENKVSSHVSSENLTTHNLEMINEWTLIQFLFTNKTIYQSVKKSLVGVVNDQVQKRLTTVRQLKSLNTKFIQENFWSSKLIFIPFMAISFL